MEEEFKLLLVKAIHFNILGVENKKKRILIIKLFK